LESPSAVLQGYSGSDLEPRLSEAGYKVPIRMIQAKYHQGQPLSRHWTEEGKEQLIIAI
jgi:hypothetical protein